MLFLILCADGKMILIDHSVLCQNKLNTMACGLPKRPCGPALPHQPQLMAFIPLNIWKNMFLNVKNEKLLIYCVVHCFTAAC